MRAFQVVESIELVKKIADRHQAGEFDFAANMAEQKTLWSARKEAMWSLLSLKTEHSEVWSTDVAVPLSRLSDIIGQ